MLGNIKGQPQVTLENVETERDDVRRIIETLENKEKPINKNNMNLMKGITKNVRQCHVKEIIEQLVSIKTMLQRVI